MRLTNDSRARLQERLRRGDEAADGTDRREHAEGLHFVATGFDYHSTADSGQLTQRGERELYRIPP